MQTEVYEQHQMADDEPIVRVSFSDWSNINSGQMRALVFVAMSVKKGDQLIIRYREQQETWCVVRNVSALAVGTQTMYLVSLQPERHRRRERNRRKSHRLLQLAYARLTRIAPYEPRVSAKAWDLFKTSMATMVDVGVDPKVINEERLAEHSIRRAAVFVRAMKKESGDAE